MHRTEHIIQRTKGQSQPKAFLAAEATAELVPHPALKDVEIERLTGWSAVSGVSREGGMYTTREESGKDAPSFWRLVERVLKRGQVTWLFLLPASRALSLLGFWEELEAGRFYLSERDYRDASNKRASMLPKLRSGRDGDIDRNRLSSDYTLQLLRSGMANGPPPSREGQWHQRERAVGYCVLEDPPTIIQCRRRFRAGCLRIVDLRNYGYSGQIPSTDAQQRSKGIAEIVLSMIRTLSDNDLGGLQNTAASQAWTAWRHRFMRHPVSVHVDAEALYLERESYYGGRTEAGRIGVCDSPVYLLDFRSFYPFVCSELAVPTRLVGRHESGTAEQVQKALSCGGAIARVHLQSSENTYPLRQNGITVFPTGSFWTVLPGPELLYALQRGMVLEVGPWAQYDTAPALAEYANRVSTLRAECERKGDAAGAEFAKRLNVSLYGKFAQTDSRWIDTVARHADSPYGCWWEIDPNGNIERWRSIAWEVQREQKARPGLRPDGRDERYSEWQRKILQRETGESCPAIASYITSAGRLLLWQAITTAGRGCVMYYDTDSLFVTEDGLWNLSSAGLVGSGEIGRLSIRAIIDRLEIRGYKHYVADGVTVCSGLPKGHISNGPDRESYYLRAWLGRNISAGIRPRAERARMFYSRSSPYLHGVVCENGWVRPHNYGITNQ